MLLVVPPSAGNEDFGQVKKAVAGRFIYTLYGKSIAIGTDQKPYTVFEVVKPVEVQAGKIALWFGEIGGGIQYEFSQKISELLQQGILRKM